MIESLYSFDKNLVMRETFNDSFSVQNNRYAKGTISATGVKFENGVAKISGSGNITYKLFVLSLSSFRMIFKYNGNGAFVLFGNPQSTTYRFYLSVTNNILNGQWGASAPAFLNITLIPNTRYELIVTPNASLYLNGQLVSALGYGRGSKLMTFYGGSVVSGNCNLNIELFEIYNRSLSSSEVKLLYQQNLYNSIQQLPLLLDFDSTRGVLEDRTGLNTLTPTNVTIQKVGEVYGAYFNASTAKIQSNNIILDATSSFFINVWYKMLRNPASNGTLFSTNTIWLSQNSNTMLLYVPNTTNTYGTSNQNIKGRWFNFSIGIKGNDIYSYNNGVFYGKATTQPRTTPTTFIMGAQPGNYNNLIGYISKLQIFKGIPSNPNDFAAQLYNQQKGNFNG